MIYDARPNTTPHSLSVCLLQGIKKETTVPSKPGVSNSDGKGAEIKNTRARINLHITGIIIIIISSSTIVIVVVQAKA